MPLPIPSFGALGPTDNMSTLDQQFGAVANMGIIYCTASGSNAVILTPITNTLTPSAYLDGAPIFAWKQAQTSTGAVTINAASLGALNAYKNNGQTAVGSSDLVAGMYYTAAPIASLNSGAGGFVVDVVPTALSAPGLVKSTFSNLEVTCTSDTQVTVTADAITLFDGTNYTTATSVNVVAATGTAGVNGLDTGAVATNKFYSVWVIQNTLSGANAALLSLSATAPTMPANYAKKARVGWVTTDIAGATTKLQRTSQNGRRAQYLLTGSAPNTALPTINSGASGTFNTTTFTGTSTAISTFAPSTAGAIWFVLSVGATAQNAALAPNANYAGYSSATNPVAWCAIGTIGTGNLFSGNFLIEGANVFYAGGANCLAQCIGWEDNL